VNTLQCLLTLANTPLIEYTLEFLAMNGVQEVFIYCGAHHEKIEAYVRESPRWSPKSGLCPFSHLDFIRVSNANSVGDFLRDLDKRALMGNDFIVVHGDLVANVPLASILAKHRARRENNRDACMTMVLREAGDDPHRTKTNGIEPIFVVDAASGRVLHYDEMHPFHTEHKVLLDMPAFENESKCVDVDIRTDLIDCGIDILTPDVLAMWSESFDYELPRKNFLHGILKDWELNGKIIHSEIINDGYAARATNLQLYESISRDVLGRWTFPFVPETNILQGQTYKMRRGCCLEDGVSSTGTHMSRSVVGKGTTFGSGTTVANSIIGRRCKIGQNVTIQDSYLWDDVTIADGATITRSILASSVAVGKNASVPAGSLLSFGVKIGDGTALAEKPTGPLSICGEDGSAIETDTSVVGTGGKGAYYRPETDDDDDDDDEDNVDPASLQKTLIYSLEGHNLSTTSLSTFASEDSFDDDDEDMVSQAGSQYTGDITPGRDRASSFASDDSAAAAARLGNFHHEAVHGLYDALRADTDDFDSAKIEFMGLRLSNNASDHAMQKAIATAFAMRGADLMAGGLEATKAANKAFTDKKEAVKFVKEVAISGDGASHQADFVLALQKALVGVKDLEPARGGNLLAAMLQKLYTIDVLEEDGILAWWADERAAAGETMGKVRARCRVIVEWLETADEEDSDEESEED
jgi:translation initiation factor eIF-2B subunit epsilon